MQNQLNGVIVIDKPAGISSAKVVAEVKRSMGAAKVGHTGTLDPFATGVLVCCLGQATRLARFFLHGSKRYEAVLRLGIATDTLDGTGQVVARHAVPDIHQDRLMEVFNRFKGPQMQQPPVYAALKHNGTPLYKLARQGKPVQKAPRAITISVLRILDIALPDVRFEVHCSAGTYVRVLCADIGTALGCGGHLSQLRRTIGCGFAIDEAVDLDALKQMGEPDRNARVIPMAEALHGVPLFRASAELVQWLSHGKPLTADMLPYEEVEGVEAVGPDDLVKVVDGADELRAVLQMAPGGTHYNYCCVFH